MQVARDFEMQWNFPNCIGAIDGKHIEIQSTGGSDYFNYLKYHSIILLAVVDARYRFLFVNVGTNGQAGEAGIFQASLLKLHLTARHLAFHRQCLCQNNANPLNTSSLGMMHSL